MIRIERKYKNIPFSTGS